MTPADEDALIDRVYADWIAGCDSGAKPVSELVRLAIRAAYAQGIKDGYLIGFNASGEGWNGEYPYGDNNRNPEDDPNWVERRDNICAAAIRKGE